MAKPQDTLKSAWSKRKRNLPLTKAEVNALRDYSRKASRASIPLYFPSIEAKKEFLAKAEQQGIRNVSAWMLEQVESAIDGKTPDSNYVNILERDLQEAREDVKALREGRRVDQKHYEEIAAQNANLSKQLSRILEKLLPDEE